MTPSNDGQVLSGESGEPWAWYRVGNGVYSAGSPMPPKEFLWGETEPDWTHGEGWVPLYRKADTPADLLEALAEAADYISKVSDRFDGHDTEGFHAAEVAERNARAAIALAKAGA